MKTLITYFSLSGVTKAATVAEICKGAKVGSAIRISDQSDDEIKKWLGIQK